MNIRRRIAVASAIAFLLTFATLFLKVDSSHAQGGGLDLNGYCQSRGYSHATLTQHNAHGWVCVHANGSTTGMDLNAACQRQYGSSAPRAVYADFNNPYSWTCQAPVNSCRQLSAYTDYFQGKPALIVYHPGGSHPDSGKITAYFWNMYRGQWEYVPKNDQGIRFDAPKHYSGEWSYFHIATRWTLDLDGEHDAWNEDRYWYVRYCG